MDRQLMRRIAFAEKYGISDATVDRWLEQELNGLKKVRIGRTVYVDVTDFKLTESSKDKELA